jgi:hypothetical protein
VSPVCLRGGHRSGSAAATEGDNSQGAMAVRWAQIADSARLTFLPIG